MRHPFFSVGLGLSDSRVAVATFLCAIPVNRTPLYAHVVKLWQSLSSRLQLTPCDTPSWSLFLFLLTLISMPAALY